MLLILAGGGTRQRRVSDAGRYQADVFARGCEIIPTKHDHVSEEMARCILNASRGDLWKVLREDGWGMRQKFAVLPRGLEVVLRRLLLSKACSALKRSFPVGNLISVE